MKFIFYKVAESVFIIFIIVNEKTLRKLTEEVNEILSGSILISPEKKKKLFPGGIICFEKNTLRESVFKIFQSEFN